MAVDFKWLKGILFQTANVLVAKTKNKKDVSSTPELKTGSELRDKNKRFLSVAAIIFSSFFLGLYFDLCFPVTTSFEWPFSFALKVVAREKIDCINQQLEVSFTSSLRTTSASSSLQWNKLAPKIFQFVS